MAEEASERMSNLSKLSSGFSILPMFYSVALWGADSPLFHSHMVLRCRKKFGSTIVLRQADV